MKRPLAMQRDFEQIGTIEGLTAVFESIASVHISQVKDRVQSSTAFFNELWGTYSQLRLSVKESDRLSIQHNGKTALVAVTAEGGLIGDIDDRIVDTMLQVYPGGTPDVIVIGSHGVSLLARRNIRPTKAYKLPDLEKGDTVRPLAELLGGYEHAIVFYQTYVSLMRQDIARIDLFSAVRTMSEGNEDKEVISSQTYILEPSTDEFVSYMESVMLGIALGQIILESELAQYASRFNAMYRAKSKAGELRYDLGLALHRAKRAATDERTKEILSGRKAIRAKR